MAKSTLVVYDSCPSYIERLLSYANSKKNSAFDIVGFTDPEALNDYLKRNEKTVLLISLNDDEDSIGQAIMILTSNSNLFVIFLGEQQLADRISSEIPGGLKKTACINKYQSADNIMAEIGAQLEDFDIRSGDRIKNLHVAGIYSPVDKVSHVRLAPVIMKRLVKTENGDKNKVLYINLEPFSGANKWLDYPKNTGISDLIYVYKTNRRKLAETLTKLRGSYCGMDVLTAPVNPEDLEELSEEDWPDFLATLSMTGGYQYILVDMAAITENLMDVIFEYGNLYIPALPYSENKTYRSVLTHKSGSTAVNDQIAMEKMREFREYIISLGRKDDFDKIMEVTVDPD